MGRICVWIRPLGASCRVRVDSKKNADWLLDRLSRSFAFKTCEPVSEDDRSSCCSFRILYTSVMSRLTLDRLMASIPEVQLMSDPA
jgi:hypothetical protein